MPALRCCPVKKNCWEVRWRLPALKCQKRRWDAGHFQQRDGETSQPWCIVMCTHICNLHMLKLPVKSSKKYNRCFRWSEAERFASWSFVVHRLGDGLGSTHTMDKSWMGGKNSWCDQCCNQKSHFWFPPPLQCCATLVMDPANDTAQGLEVRTWFCQDDRHHTLRRDFGKFDEKRFNEPYWHVEWDEERQNSFSVQNQVNRSGLVYTVMICDVLGNVGDFDDAWDGTNTGANNLCAQSNL